MTIHVHELGVPGGAPVLAIHGVSAHGRRFVPVAPLAFPAARVLAPDLRGHGRSSAEGPGTVEDHVADMLGVLDRFQLDQVVVVAHSFGGCIATFMMALAPERVRSVVLLDPAMGLPSALSDERRAAMIASDAAYPSLEDLITERRRGRSDAAIPHSDADTTLAAVQGTDGWRLPWDREIVSQAWTEMSRPLPSISTPRPTLLLDATQAGLVTSSQCDHMRAELGDLLTIERFNLGHMLYWDDLYRVSARIRAFLSVHAPEVGR